MTVHMDVKLLENGSQRPLLQSSNARSKHARVVLPFQAVHEEGIVPFVEHDREKTAETFAHLLWLGRVLRAHLTRTKIQHSRPAGNR